MAALKLERLTKQIEDEEEPAASWDNMMNKKRNKPTVESLVKKGRSVVSRIVMDLLETV